MVFKELLSAWHDESPLAAIFKKFDRMIVLSKEMFDQATAPLAGQKDDGTLRRRLVQTDQQINTLHQEIRRDIMTHLAVREQRDAVACLQLFSITKDAERIGDYCKNIDEVIHRAPLLLEDPLLPDLLDMRAKTLIWFDQTKRSFDREEADLARAVQQECYLMEKECDRLVWDLSANNRGRNAVAPALIIRFFKRVAAHLSNVCSSVTMPLDKLDYHDKPGHPGEIEEDAG